MEKKINTSPDIDQLKREIKYLENKNRNYERQLGRIKLQETESYQFNSHDKSINIFRL